MSDPPAGPIEAVVHHYPYPYYAQLRRDRPLYFDESSALWVASSSAIAFAALEHPALLVRPPGEPVPRSLIGTPAGEVFALLVRMNDGEFHARHKPAVREATGRLSLAQVAQVADQAALDLAPRVDANALLSALPTQAMARLLGVPPDLLDATARWVGDFAQGIAPQALPDDIQRASLAAQHLMAQGESQGLDKVRAANRIALMQQSLDATAGLLGNTARLLLARPELVSAGAPIERWRPLVAEVARWDAPVQNTRRFAASDLVLAGQRMEQGQGVLLLLGSANRDASLNPDPDVFQPDRAGRRSLTFGSGAHACPGEAIAIEIASAGLHALHEAGDLQRLLSRPSGFRALTNARVPIFTT